MSGAGGDQVTPHAVVRRRGTQVGGTLQRAVIAHLWQQSLVVQGEDGGKNLLLGQIA